ncbi:ATP-binding protein [Agromyces sp. H66]|uniref:ATP-binding protein n=1 Tax=Agromyces sp. H66 TaxID=2529859 RepID=UPI0010A9C3D9|nr:ATP-binding protein [Agromyces sp. H66]
MSRMRLTQQEADPLGGITAAPLVAIGAALAFGFSIVLTIVHWSDVGRPLAAVIAIGLVGAAGVVAAVSTTPSRAPFASERLWLIVALAVAGAIAEYLSTIGANSSVYDDFGSIVVGTLILSVAPYCTWISLLLAGVISAAVLSFLVVGSASAIAVDVPIASLIALNSVAVLALAAAAAGYSAAVVDETLAWQREANRAALQRDAELRAGIARSVQQSRVSVLGREVLPFLAGVMTADRISVADADRARELAETLRHALKAGIESTWLDELAADLQPSGGVPIVIDDATGAADDLNDDQRSALTALLVWLGDGGRSAEIRVTFRTDPDRSGISIVAGHGSSPPTRRELDRFTAVARAVAMGAEATLAGENVKVELRHVAE